MGLIEFKLSRLESVLWHQLSDLTELALRRLRETPGDVELEVSVRGLLDVRSALSRREIERGPLRGIVRRGTSGSVPLVPESILMRLKQYDFVNSDLVEEAARVQREISRLSAKA